MPRVAAQTNEMPDPAPEPIAIVGVGLRFPGGSNSLEEFETFLREGRSGIGPLPTDRWNVDAFTPDAPGQRGKIHTTGGGFLDHVDRFDAAFFNISPKEAQYMDPQQRMLLETAWQALEHAGIDPTPLRRGDGGVYIGASSIDYALELEALPYDEMDGHLASGITMFPLSGRISYFLGWRGPSMSIDTACSSSLVAMHLAVQGLRAGECEIALCGGVNAVHHPRIPVMFSNAQMLAPDGQCKTFDESADGYARAEGCGVLVLKRLSDATRDGDEILALIRGTAVGQDGDSAGLTVPNGPAQEKTIRAALAAAHLQPADIQYVEAHGTGTPLGDPIEFGAIGDAFADSHTTEQPLLVGSVKTNLGHMEPASGLVGVIKTLLQLRSATIFPHLNLTQPSGRIPWDLYPVRVPTQCEPWKAPVRRAVVNSFGFAGTIGAVVLEQAPPATPRDQPPAEETTGTGNLFTLSAKSAAALRDQATAYRTMLTDHPDVPLDALCRTAHTTRAHFPYRVAGPVPDHAALDRLLEKAETAEHEGPAGIRKIAFMFSGQGSQYPGMGAALYNRYALFREHVDACDALFSTHLDHSVRDLLLGTDPDTEAIHRTAYTQPALFTLEFALAHLWMSWGARPNVLIGHSIGEVVAAAIAGVLDLPDAVRLVAARARLMQAVRAEGGMAAVNAPAEDVEPLLADHPDLALAAINAPDQCVISGETTALEKVTAQLRESGARVDRLSVSHAFHSPQMAEVYDDFRHALEGITFHEPTITLISNQTGKAARHAQIGNPDYWVRHIGEPVRFLAGIRAVAKRGRHAMIEIGPSSALTAIAQRGVERADHVWLTSLRRRDRAGTALPEALCAYYTAGLPVSWDGLHEGRPALERIALPTYAFQRKRHWLPAVGPRRTTAGGAAHHPLLGTRTQTPAADTPGAEMTGMVEFTADLAAEDLGALADLATDDGLTVPAAAWVDLLLALQDAVRGHTAGALRQLRLHTPLLLAPETVTTLTTRLRPRPDGSCDIEVSTLTDGEQRTHATARLDPDTPDTPAPVTWQPPADISAPDLRIDAEDLYTDLSSVGHPHGERARLLRQAARHDDGLLTATIDGRSATAVQHLPAELLHAALTACTALDPDGPVREPRTVDAVHLHRKPRGGDLQLTARIHTDHDHRTADLRLTEDGRPVADLTGVRLERPEPPTGRRRFLHRPDWLRRALPAPTTTAARHVVLCDRDGTTRPALAGLTVTECADTAHLAAALKDPSVTDVCWIWRTGDPAAEPGVARLRAECEANYRELLTLPAALAGAAARRPPRLWLVTEGAQWLPGDDGGDGSHLAAATVWGFGRVLLSEYAQYRTTLVDLTPHRDSDGDGGAGWAALAAELAAQPSGEYQVALRGQTRYVRRLLAGDTTADTGEFALHAPDSGDLSDLALSPAALREPEGDEIRLRVTAVALTAEDAAAATDTGRGESGEPAPVLGSTARGTVIAAGPHATHHVGAHVEVTHPGTLRSTLTVPSADARPAPATPTADTTTADAYRLDEAGEALRAAADTTTWIHLDPDPESDPDAGQLPHTSGLVVRPDRTYLVTGGLGGLGLVTAEKLLDLGARHLTLVSRSGRPTPEAAPVLERLAARAHLDLVQADVASAPDIERLTAHLAAGELPLGGIIHAAGSFNKTLIADLTWEAVDEQLAAKAYGGWLLHEATASFPHLEFFVAYSSIASVLGGATQGHYAAAGAALDSLTAWRTRQGLPGLSVNWAAWARVGMSARLEDHLIAEIERSGVRFFSPTRALDALARLGGRPRTQRLVGEFDWDAYTGGGVEDALYDRLAHPGDHTAGGFDPDALAALPAPERLTLISKVVRDLVAAALHMDAGDELAPTAEFLSLGLDSLMAMSVKTGLENAFHLPLPASLTYDHPTVRHLAAFLDHQLAPTAATA